MHRTVKCSHCDGHGIVAHYSATDFEGEAECAECGGSGRFTVYPNDRLAQYPGGPFRGSWPGAYTKASEASQTLK